MPKAKQQFIDLIAENVRTNGLDELSASIIGILYVEPKEIALDELAERTGYSLSAISTGMKLLENWGFIKRIRKPKSRKIYFYMEKDLMEVSMRITKQKLEKFVRPSKEKLPKIIEHYKSQKSKYSQEEIEIIEGYYKQILKMEKVMTTLLQITEGVKKWKRS